MADVRRSEDRELFEEIIHRKEVEQRIQRGKENRELALKENALQVREFMNMSSVYKDPKTPQRRAFEARYEKIDDKDKYNRTLGRYMSYIRKEIGFEIDLNSPDEDKLAFEEALRMTQRMRKQNVYGEVVATDLNGKQQTYVLTEGRNIELTIQAINGGVEGLDGDVSDSRYVLAAAFDPVKWQLEFVHTRNVGKGRRIIRRRRLQASQVVEHEEELPMHDMVGGEFFPFVNLSNADLSVLQIFRDILPQNYTDNCFVFS
jgi:hypothetical protein